MKQRSIISRIKNVVQRYQDARAHKEEECVGNKNPNIK